MPPPSLSAEQIRLLRLKSNRLLPDPSTPLDSPAQVVKAVLGVQAQDLPAALLSIRARSRGLTADLVHQARQVEHSILWTWCLRGTLHLVAVEDAAWLVPFFAPRLIAGDRRRMAQLGWDEASTVKGLRLLQTALSKSGGLTRPEIVRLLKENGLPHVGQAPVHLIFRAALEGILCYGADRGSKPEHVLYDSWAGELHPHQRETALAEIARRYLAAYAPAAPADLAAWSGIKPAEAREAWTLIADDLVPVEAAGQPAWMLKSQLSWLDETAPTNPHVRLLPRYDTYLMGYANRGLIVEAAYARRINAGGGIIHPVLLVDGQALGIWKAVRRGARLEIEVEPFERLPAALTPFIESEAADIARFLSLEIQK